VRPSPAQQADNRWNNPPTDVADGGMADPSGQEASADYFVAETTPDADSRRPWRQRRWRHAASKQFRRRHVVIGASVAVGLGIATLFATCDFVTATGTLASVLSLLLFGPLTVMALVDICRRLRHAIAHLRS
jgi:hypothetical protein